VLVVAPSELDGVTTALVQAGETVWRLGDIRAGERGVEWMER
jgi:phosphoribosylaminoimidazole (AIR) synthetase